MTDGEPTMMILVKTAAVVGQLLLVLSLLGGAWLIRWLLAMALGAGLVVAAVLLLLALL